MVYEFNFHKVFELMENVYPQAKLNQKDCQTRWSYLYNKQKQEKKYRRKKS